MTLTDGQVITMTNEIVNRLTNEVMRLQTIIDTTSEEPEWAEDFEKLDKYTKLGYSLIDIEIAKKWHAAYRKAQNSNMLRKQENERLREDAEQYEISIKDRLDVIDQQAVRIKELEAELAEMHKCTLEVAGFLAEKKNLEDKIKELKESLKNEKEWVSQYQKWLIEEVAEGMSENGFADDDLRQKARDSLILDGKIGPDADAKSRVWKITKDRVDALKGEINGYDVYDNDIETHSLKMRRKNVLKTMLKEATD